MFTGAVKMKIMSLGMQDKILPTLNLRTIGQTMMMLPEIMLCIVQTQIRTLTRTFICLQLSDKFLEKACRASERQKGSHPELVVKAIKKRDDARSPWHQ